MNVVALKAAVAVATLAVLVVLWRCIRNGSDDARVTSLVSVPACWLVARFLPWLVVYVVFGYAPQSDVATAFWPQALGALRGDIPYRDFESFFGPLFPYLLSIPLVVWESPKAIILFLTLLEAAAVVLTLKTSGLGAPSRERAIWLVIYFVSPGPLLLAVIGGQEDFLLWLGGVAVWLLVSKARDVRGGAMATLMAAVTKPLFVIAIVAVAATSRRPWRILYTAVPLGIGILWILWHVTGRAFLSVLSQAGNISPPNIWIWLHWLSGGRIEIAIPALSAAMLVAVIVFGGIYFRLNQAAVQAGSVAFFGAWTVVFAVSMLINLKSLGAYFGIFALPALTVFFRARDRWAMIAWLVLGTVGPIECSLWYRTGEQLLTGFPPSGLLALEYALQGVMLWALVVIAFAAHRLVRHANGRQSPA